MSKKKVSTVELNVLSHSLVSEMKTVPEGEKGKILKKYGVSEDQLPKMLVTDPAALALKANIGDLVLIKRKDLSGSYDSYRVVVKS